MTRSIRIIISAVLILAASMYFGTNGLCASPKGEKPKSDAKGYEGLYAQMEIFADAVSAIRADYVEEADSKKMIYGALRGMLGSLDDYSLFMDPAEHKEIKEEVKGEFGGLGVEINMKDGILTVLTPIVGSPADKAGVMAGDRIVKIDGKITKKLTLDEAVKELRGDPGTTVTITVWRDKVEKVLDITITRAIIKVESVRKAVMLEDKIGYVKIIEFQEKTPSDLEKAIEKLKKEGMDSLILDLRNNPGGLMDISVAVAEKFLPKGSPIVSTKSRIPAQNLSFKVKGSSANTAFPLVVLINEGSASAAEITAGAIQDNKRGIIVGTKSYGKGSVQTVIPLKDGSALRLTTASYFTPSGRNLRGEGIVPDVIVQQEERHPEGTRKRRDIFKKLEPKPEDKPAPEEPEDTQDVQLERAIDILKGIKAYKKAVVT